MTRFLPFLIVACTLCTSCEIPLGSKDETPEGEPGEAFSIITNGTYYEAQFSTESRWFDLDIPNTFTNKLSYPVYFYGCRPPNAGQLQMLTDEGWQVVYSPIYQECLSPAVRVMPEESVELPSSLSACFPGQRCLPEFFGSLRGTYRLIYPIYSSPDGTDLTPEIHRVSNSFELQIVN